MASSFLGLYVQRDALLLAQKALDITGNNISNIDTKGYSRQRVDIVSVSHARNTLGYNTSVSLAGQGAEALGVTQIRNKIYDKKVRNYSGDLCDVGVKVNTLGDIEDIFDSIEADSAEVEASFAAVVNKLKAALQGYTADHADRAEMGNIAMNTAEGLAQALRRYSLDLDKVSDETIMDAQKTTDRINEIFAEMGNLNKQIKDSYISMGYIESDTHNYQVQSQYGPLELKDEMNNLLDELAQYGNIEFQEEWDGTFSVKFADQLVVSGKYYAQMATTELDPRPTELGFIITQTDLKDAWTPETNDKGVPTKGLYDKDTWYDMNIENNTAGDYQLLVRKLSNEKDPNKKVDVMDITGKTPNGSQYLDTGSLRGLLDMYNGRGLFATDAVDAAGNIGKKDAAIQNDVKAANKALAELAELVKDPSAEGYTEKLNEIADTLKDCIGAKLKVDDTTRTVTVTVGNDVEIFDGTTATELTAENPDEPNDYDNIVIKAGDETVRTIALNSHSGIEYYRDLLNSFAATLADKFNGVYAAIGPHTVTTGDGTELLSEDGTIVGLKAEQNTESGAFELKDAEGNIIATLDDSITDQTAADAKLAELQDALTKLSEDGELSAEEFSAAEQTVKDILGKDAEVKGKVRLFEHGDDFRHAAENLRIAQQWLDDPEIVADPTGENEYEELDNTYIHKLLALFSNDITYSDGMGHTIPTERPLDKFVSYVNEQVGTQKGSEEGVYNATDIMLETVEIARSEAMDVSMNEEGVNMMNYQKWYNAISRMVSTLDEALDKLINNTGLVGLR